MSDKQQRQMREALGFAFKLVLGLLIVSPLFYAVSVSLMPRVDVLANPPRLLPSAPTLRNFQKVMELVPVGRYLLNSLVVSGIEIAAQVLFSSFAAYAFAFLEFRGKNLLFMMVIATMMIPGETTVISNYLTIQNLSLIDTYGGLVLPGLVSGMGIFLLRQFYLTVPRDIKDAATVDGCGHIAFFFRILMPISLTSITSLSIYTFVRTYNAFFWPLLVTNTDNMRTVQIGIGYLLNSEAVDYGVVMAGAVLALVIPILVFIVGLKYLVSGMVTGAIKG